MEKVLETDETGGQQCCVSQAVTPLVDGDAERLARQLKALADPTRLKLLSIVAASEAAEACVCDLTDPVGLSQPTVSHHLRVLTEAGFLTRTKRGTWSYYRLVREALEGTAGDLVSSVSCASHGGDAAAR
ncbi:ArsR/SmtB family transcription factor [Paramicrobacterium sp. CJ85]|uniref:ArsR/SmtB family transcription factor n=1 Tax=Paramicrobacterium sp. CJ85 TaxID=3445355 RepID=UPI003F5FDA32